MRLNLDKKQYQKQKEKRLKAQMKRFKDFGVLSEADLLKLADKEAWVMNYLKEHTFITLSNLTGDFLNDEWNMSLIGQHITPNTDIRRLLIYSFRPIIQKLCKAGLLTKFNTRTYKVVKE